MHITAIKPAYGGDVTIGFSGGYGSLTTDESTLLDRVRFADVVRRTSRQDCDDTAQIRSQAEWERHVRRLWAESNPELAGVK